MPESEPAIQTLQAITDAAQGVIDNWESGDLALAVTELSQWIPVAREVVAGKLSSTRDPAIDTTEKHGSPLSKAAVKFAEIVNQIPQYCAVFTVTRFDESMHTHGLTRGHEVRFYVTVPDCAWYHTKGHPSIADGTVNHVTIAPSKLKFLRYERIEEFPWDSRRVIQQGNLRNSYGKRTSGDYAGSSKDDYQG